MKFIKHIIFLLTISCATSIHCQSDKEIETLLQNYLIQYPQAQICDIYKSCFQDYFGPGHIISDTAASANYLRNEMSAVKSFGGPLYEPTGIHGNYYRVNISVVAEGTVPFDLMISALHRSAEGTNPRNIEIWHQQWNRILYRLQGILPWTEERKADSSAIEDMLSNGKYVMHHSPQYNEAYNFHYRIIRKDIFELEIKPLL